MLRVAICDDSALERDILADFLSHYCNAHAIDYSCKMYDSGEPLYYELGDGGWFDIILLDILMDPPLGIDVARRLREIGYKGTIVFCTAALDFAPCIRLSAQAIYPEDVRTNHAPRTVRYRREYIRDQESFAGAAHSARRDYVCGKP